MLDSALQRSIELNTPRSAIEQLDMAAEIGALIQHGIARLGLKRSSCVIKYGESRNGENSCIGFGATWQG